MFLNLKREQLSITDTQLTGVGNEIIKPSHNQEKLDL